MVNCEHCKRELEETEERFLNWLCSECAIDVEERLAAFEEEQYRVAWENAALGQENV